MSKAEQSDKLTQVLDAVEHPERYTDEQLRELLCDEECADYYRLLCDASSAYDEALEIDDTEINAAWQQIAGQKREKKMTFRKMVATLLAILALSGISYAAIRMIQSRQETSSIISVSDNAKPIGPSAEKQEAIADTLTAMDEEIEALETERDKMIQIREGAMDDLLTGRVRLSV